MGFLKKFTKQEISWMMYDWANSAHSVIVVTILPIFFDTVAGYTADSVSSMSTWGFATSLAMAIVALSAPVLGVFGENRVNVLGVNLDIAQAMGLISEQGEQK